MRATSPTNGPLALSAFTIALLAVFLGLAALPSAAEGVRADIDNPYDDEALPIPGDAGMEHFYGEWWPGGQSDADIFQWMRFHRDGRITYDYHVKPDDPRIITEHYRVLAFDTKSVLLNNRYWNDIITPNRYVYDFWLLTIVPDRYDPNPEMMQHICDDHRLNDAVWDGPTAEMLQIYQTSSECNPRINGASAKYPWSRWGYGRYSFQGKFE